MKTEKLKIFYQKHFHMSVFEIALAGIFVALWIISNQFITIDFGIMRAGIVYVWAILIGLTTKPAVGLLTAIVADNLALAFKGGFGYWMIEYAIIYPSITLFASLFKLTFKLKNQKIWWIIMLSINAIVIIGAVIFAIVKNDFVSHSQNADTAFDFTSDVAKIAIWVCMALITIMALALSFLAWKKPDFKFYLAIFSLVSATIILFIWLWGPIAQVRYLIRLFGTAEGGKSYWSLYDIYLTGRVLKTPIILPIYAMIVSLVYGAYNSLNIEGKKANRWT